MNWCVCALQSLEGFRGLSKFKKTAVNLIAFSLTPDKVTETLNVDMHVHAHTHERLSRVHCIQSHALSGHFMSHCADQRVERSLHGMRRQRRRCHFHGRIQNGRCCNRAAFIPRAVWLKLACASPVGFAVSDTVRVIFTVSIMHLLASVSAS